MTEQGPSQHNRQPWWALKHEGIIKKLLLAEHPNVFDNTIRDRPEEWTIGVWRSMYNFRNGGSGLGSQYNNFVEGKFSHMVDPKDGYLISDYMDAQKHRLLEFIIPIIHPDKPTRVTITIGNTIFRALDGGHSMDWSVIFRDLSQRLLAGVEKSKLTPISPFLFHLYESKGILTEEEETEYKTG